MKILLVAGALLSTVSMPALAQTSRHTRTTTTSGGYTAVTVRQDPPYIAYPDVPPPPPQYPSDPYIDYAPIPLDVNVFDGLRIEGQVGFDRIRDAGDTALFTADGNGRNGVSYGGEVGVDLALGSAVTLGAYAGYEGSSIEQCQPFLGSTLCAKPSHSFTAGARIGFVAGRSALLYAKGGYTLTRLDVVNRSGAGVNNRFEGDLDGFHVGGGVEAAFGRHAYGKLEYVYTRLGNLRAGDLQADGNTDFDRHQVKAGLGLRL